MVFTNVELKLSKLLRNAPITSTYESSRQIFFLFKLWRCYADESCFFCEKKSLQQYCVLNQILEFHSIVQAQVGRLAALKDYMQLQRPDLLNDRPSNDDVGTYVGIVQRTFQGLGRICQELRNAANVLRLPSRRRFPHCSFVDHTFKPPLPSELIVEFSIHRGELVSIGCED